MQIPAKTWQAFSTLAVILLGSSPAILLADGDRTAQPLDGRWRAVSAEYGGRALPKERIDTLGISFEGNRYRALISGAVDEGRWTADWSAEPPRLDLIGEKGPSKGKTLRALIQVSGGRMRIAFSALASDERPESFDSGPANQVLLIEYSRDRDPLPRQAATKTTGR